MKLMMMSFLIIFTMIMVMSALIMIISKKNFTDSQKATPFECGFNPMSYNRIPFSIHFFMIAVIFLIFDIEIIMIMPMILTTKTTVMKFWMYTSIMFTFILGLGLIHEWNNGMIHWTN